MSYTVFALKWRPQNFAGLIGQGHIVATLKNAIQNNRLAHAYIFSGPRGVGKTSCARILAKALNCKDSPTINPCGACPACLEIAQGRSLDVIEIDGASNRGIDEIRALRENVKFPPANGKFKIYIIDEVHMLTTEAFNALLKTLEEPPDFVKFIFATTQAHKVIPTILSRCQRLDFRRIPQRELIAQLENISRQERIGVDKEALFAIARASDGSLRDAESLLDQLASFSKERISLNDITSILGSIEQDTLFGLTDKIIQKDPLAALVLLNTLIDEGKDPQVFLANLIEHFRNLMVAKVAKVDMKLIDLPEEACEKLLKQAQRFSLEEIFSAFNILVNTQEMSKRMNSMRIPLEISLVKLASEKKGSSPNPANISQQNSKQADKEHTASKELQANDCLIPQAATNPIEFSQIQELWQKAIDSLAKVKISAATYLKEGQPVKIENDILTVSFPKNLTLHKESLEAKENKNIIERILAEVFQASLRINFILSKETAQKEESQDDAFLQSALSAFKARVIKEN